MKKTLLFSKLLFAAVVAISSVFQSQAQCLNSTAFGTGTIGGVGTTVTLTTCAFASEYSTINGVTAGNFYNSTGTGGTGNFITIRQGTFNGPVVAFGFSPLLWQATTSGPHFQHVNTDASCGTDATCHNLSVSNVIPPVDAPPAPVQDPASPTCIAGTALSLTGTPPANVTWYWQTTALGTSTANPGATPWVVFLNGTYFARAFDSVLNAWSSASSYTVTNMPVEMTPPAPIAAQNPVCLPGTEVTMPAPPADVNYFWQTDPNGVSTSSSASTPTFASQTGPVYVSAYNTVTQCWSVTNSTSVSVNTLVPFDPTATITSFNICSGATTQPIEANAISLIPGSLQAAATSNNGCGGGAMFNISSNAMPLTITGLDVRSQAAGTQNVVVWWKPTTYTDALNNQAAWTQIGTYPINAPAAQALVFIDIDDFLIPANTTVGFYVQYNAAYFNITAQTTYSNADMTITAGHGHCSAFSAGINNRAFSGTVYYNAGMNSSVVWYDALTGGNQIGAGSPFETVGSALIGNPASVPGTYTFYATAIANGCESINRLPIDVSVSNVGGEITPINVTCNGGENGSFSFGNVTCGTAPFTFAVDGGAFEPIPTNLTAGLHSVIVKDANELESGTYQFTLTEPSAIDNLTATILGPNSVQLAWTTTGNEIQWNVEYGPTGFTPGTGTTIQVLNNPEDILGLTPSTNYQFYVQSACGPNGTWVGPVSASTPQIPVSVFPWNEGFETGGTEWSVLNSTNVNQWIVGTAVSSSGTQSLYVTNDAGVSNAFTINAFSVSQAYRDIQFPTTSGEIQLSFNWRNFGESCCDWIQVWLVPIDFMPQTGTLAGNQITANLTGDPLTQRINLTGNLNLQNGWQTWQGIIPAEYAGSFGRLVFQWRNDGSIGTQPPGAIDNVSIIVGDCPRPNPVTVADVTQNSALVSWTPGNVDDNSWIIEYGPQGFQLGTGTQITVTENPYLLENLDNSTFYTLYMQTACSPNGTSIYSNAVNFQTQFGCGGTFQDDGGLAGNYPNNMNKVYTICPDDAGDYVEIIFDMFDTQVQTDGFYIYNGDAVDLANIIPSGNPAGLAPMLAPNGYWGTQLTGQMFESSGAGECLTFNFLSNASIQLPGWEASIGCFPCIPTPGVDGELDVCRLDGSIDLNSVVTLNSDRGFWTLPGNPGLVFDESMLNVGLMPEGTFEVYYIVNTPCTSDTTVATIHIYPPSSAGTSGVLVNCNNGFINLYEGLTGNIDLGGQWYSPAGQPLNSALVQVNGQLSGVYNYYYVTSNGVCPADTSYSEVTLLNCIGLTENEIAGFELYPNPTADVVFLSYSGENINAKVYLVDAKGSVISVEERMFETNSTFEISMTELQSGVYFVTIVSETGRNIMQVVKQ